MSNVIELKGTCGKDYKAETIQAFLEDVDKSFPVIVKINSLGGDPLEAVSIFNMLLDYEGVVHTVNDGMAASAAAIILLAGDKIAVRENALTMFHGPRLAKGIKGTTEEMENAVNALKAAKEQMSKTIQARTGKDPQTVGKILAKDSWYTSSKAKKDGIVDEVIKINPRRINLAAIMDPPAELVAEVEIYNKGVDTMSYKELCASFEIDIENVDDEELEGKVSEFIKSLQGKVSELEAKIPELEAKIPKPKASLPKGIVKALVRGRDTEIDNLVGSGKITAAVCKELKKGFCDVDMVAKFVTEDGDIEDSFDSTMEALRKNETVMSFKGKTGTQPLGDPNKSGVNPLLADAERRAKGEK